MILQIIISNGILDLVTGILAKISLGTGIWAKFRLGTGIWYPLHDPLCSVESFIPCETEKTFLQSFDSLTDVTVLQRDHKKRKTNRLKSHFELCLQNDPESNDSNQNYNNRHNSRNNTVIE